MTQPMTDAGADPGTRRRLVLAAAAAGALVFGAAGLLLLGGGDEPPAAPAPLAATAVGAVGPSAAPTAAAVEPEPTAEPRPGGSPRDPFRALQVSAPTGVAAAAPAPAPVPPVAAEAVPVPDPAQPAPARDTGPPASSGSAPATPAPAVSSYRLRAVTGADATLAGTFVVDAGTVSAKAGERVGALTLLSLHQGPAGTQWTAVLQKGSAEPFDLVLGSTVRR